MSGSSPVVMIGLDAAELTLVERLCDEGVMPNLRALRRSGCCGRLAGPATTFSGGVWPTLYTARQVPWHGIYQHRMWRPELMRHELIEESWLPEPPFFRALDHAGLKVAVIDLPMLAGPPQPMAGVHVSGWGTHDLIYKGSWPPSLWGELAASVGPPAVKPDGYYGPPTVATLLRIRDDLLRSTAQLAGIGEGLLAREPWDLFLAVLGATHRGGHHFWNLSQVETGAASAREIAALHGALVEIYRAVDAALGRLLARAPSRARIVVLAVHGMGPNNGWAERCGDLLGRIAAGRQETPAHGVLFAARNALSLDARRRFRGLIPRPVRNLLASWSQPRFDWATTRFFPLDMDLAGYVRFNVVARESAGIVHPGEEYADLCRHLAESLLSLRELESGEPVVARVLRHDDLAPAAAPYRSILPDLVVEWAEASAITGAGVVAPAFGELRFSDGGRLQSGRSGNHRGGGWFVATGPGLQPSADPPEADVADVVPTVLRWLGVPPLPGQQGAPVAALFAQREAARWRAQAAEAMARS